MPEASTKNGGQVVSSDSKREVNAADGREVKVVARRNEIPKVDCLDLNSYFSGVMDRMVSRESSSQESHHAWAR